MSEKLKAGVITAFVIAPICSICILGPAVIGSFFGGLTVGFGGFDPFITFGLVMAVAVVFHIIKKKRSHMASKGAATPVSNQLTSSTITTSD